MWEPIGLLSSVILEPPLSLTPHTQILQAQDGDTLRAGVLDGGRSVRRDDNTHPITATQASNPFLWLRGHTSQ